MAGGLLVTTNYLARTVNEAAVPVLAAALDSHYTPLRTAALKTLSRRENVDGHLAILARFDQLSTADWEFLVTNRHRMHATFRAAMLGDDRALCEVACRAVLALNQYDQLPVLVEATTQKESRAAACTAATLVQLARSLAEEVQRPVREGARDDPFFSRRQALAALANSLDTYQLHQRLEVVEAFLLLAPHDHAALHAILGNAFHPCHEPMLQSLRSSPAVGVLKLLASLIKDTKVPMELLQLIASRTDTRFLDYLMYQLGNAPSLRVLQNMSRLTHVPWLQEERQRLLRLDGSLQATAVKLAMGSGIRKSKILSLLATLIEEGGPVGRAAACEALAGFSGPRADELVQYAWQDSDPAVRAAALRQLRRRNLPGAFDDAVAHLDMADPQLHEAAQQALSDFTFQRYVSEYAEMGEAQRREDGKLVGKADPGAREMLLVELGATSPSQRRRGVELAEHLNLVHDVADSLVGLLLDDGEDVATRSEAARILASCPQPSVTAALREAAAHAPSGVRLAAQSSLEEQAPLQQTP